MEKRNTGNKKARPYSGKPKTEKPKQDKPQWSNPSGKPQTNKPQTDKPQWSKPSGKPQSGKARADKPRRPDQYTRPAPASAGRFERSSNAARSARPERPAKQPTHIKLSPTTPAPIRPTLAPEPEQTSLILEGRKAVLEALNHEKPVDRVLIRKDADKPVEGTLRVIAAKAKERGIVVQEVVRAKLDELSETGHHQGVLALCPAAGYVEIADILAIAEQKGEQPFVVVLDGVTDPHNLGAVLRTAEAGGAHGVIVPKRRAVGLTGTVAKTSAGAIEHMPVARVTNISQALDELKKAGLWIACADMGGQSMFEADLAGPVALVLGAEGVGVSRLVAEKSDFSVSIPMLGKIASLNVSVAAGVLIYEVVRRRSR